MIYLFFCDPDAHAEKYKFSDTMWNWTLVKIGENKVRYKAHSIQDRTEVFSGFMRWDGHNAYCLDSTESEEQIMGNRECERQLLYFLYGINTP